MLNNILKVLVTIAVISVSIKLLGFFIGALVSLAAIAIPVAIVYAIVKPKETNELTRSNIR
ncbi:MAG: hypothetical protein LBM94_02230 [Propionibacteriaceae bacterium]|jgi:hypothetical protein|nr:hypothetical protein [Propionibacteriaceae bacterium]